MIHMSYIFNTYTPCGILVYGKWAAGRSVDVFPYRVVEESTKINDVTCPKCIEVETND